MDFTKKLTQKDYLIDEIKSRLGHDDNSSPCCDICGVHYSWKRVTVKSEDYEAAINVCEDCHHSIEIADDNNRVRKYEIISTEEVY